MELHLDPIFYINPIRNRKRFTLQEIREIEKMYPDTPNFDIARKMCRTKSSIQNLANKMDWRKSAEYMATKPGCFNKGKVPWNKGVKGYMGANRTSFYKGDPKCNDTTLPMGHISLRYHKREGRAYKYIKTVTGMRLLQRVTWERHNGEIPKGHIIAFKDGDSMNCDISNLFMLSRAENMERNRNHKKFSETMRQIWHRERIRYAAGLKPITGFGKRLK